MHGEVDHPGVVEHYREGHDVYLASVNGGASTEDMRRGFVSYRSLFAELLDDRSQDDRSADDPTRTNQGAA